ncbi:MAG: DUF21 domain-containing protein [Planctomycetales bacterium]|nr:DUF21 domain-containing protein [Planctomycetales bacterium]
MTVLIISLAVVLTTWAACSLAEAAIYAVRMPYIRSLERTHPGPAQILRRFKENMEQPISAILIINTIVAAAGASYSGALASDVLGESKLGWFSACFTLAALLLAEIIPKIVGVSYHRVIARLIARPLAFAVAMLYPTVWLIERASVWIKPRVPIATAPEDEVQLMAAISAEEGSIMPYEALLVRHVLDLDKVTAREIMTPSSVVTKVPDLVTLGELASEAASWTFSRIPIFDAADPDCWTGIVLTREVLAAITQDRGGETVGTLAKPLYFVREDTPGHTLLRAFLRSRTHMFGVAGSHGGVLGIVTLEDVLESLIGAEIVDESDTVVDMQALARMRNSKRSRNGQ